MGSIDDMLNQVTLIREKYDAIAKAKGDDFNVFLTLGLEDKELRHSKFIAELLNPKGSHGRDNTFLKLFLGKIETPAHDIQDLENAIVETEHRRNDAVVDIAIIGNQKQILIENKIYASDQEQQLVRYRQAYPSATIIYLTLDEHDPSDNSSISNDGGEKIEYSKLSYKTIIEWLEQCKEKAVDFPLLRETITQYIDILNYLTGQTKRVDMSKEIVNVISKSRENIESAIEIAKSVNDVIKDVVQKRFFSIIEDLANEYNFDKPDYDIDTFSWTKGSVCSIRFSNDLLRRNRLNITFQFCNPGLIRMLESGFSFNVETGTTKDGFKKIYDEKNLLRDYLKEKGKPYDPWYLFYECLCKRLNLIDLYSETIDIKKMCGRKISEMVALLDEFSKKHPNQMP